ncbi:MAG TPA: DUF3043 domain-containing protein [Actinomycetes bacterium]|nr:DUF3043 domain-containing protein [Actinomycetes bacterium]
MIRPLLRRRSSSSETATPTDVGETPEVGKGRPTPKRRDAEHQRRQAVRAPKDRKEAYRRTRERARQERMASRQALLTGEEKNLPARDRGPVRRLARNYVDSRRSAAEFFLPVALVVLLATFVRNEVVYSIGILLWLVLLAVVIVDSFILARGLRKTVEQRFPDEQTKGTTAYALLRSMQLRRLRLPKPQVKPGATI